MRTRPLALVVDDDPIFRKMLEVVLGNLGLTVKTAENLDEFFLNSMLHNPEIYLVDLQIGQDSGISAVERLRQLDGVTAPILVISGNANLSTVSHALEIGANDYIVKPFDKALLASKLHQFVKTSELDDQEKFVRTFDGNGAEARLNFEGRLVRMDELGMCFACPHLVAKGTVIRLAGGVLAEIDPGRKDYLLCVTATSLDSASGDYEIYAEFEGADTNFLQAVRRWLSERLAAKNG